MLGNVHTQRPNPFPERGAASAISALSTTPSYEAKIIINMIDELQMHNLWVDDSDCMRTRTAAPDRTRQDYVVCIRSVEGRIRQITRQSLVGWIVKTEATTLSEIDAREELRECCLTPQVVPMDQYLASLNDQARGASVASMRTIPSSFTQLNRISTMRFISIAE